MTRVENSQISESMRRAQEIPDIDILWNNLVAGKLTDEEYGQEIVVLIKKRQQMMMGVRQTEKESGSYSVLEHISKIAKKLLRRQRNF